MATHVSIQNDRLDILISAWHRLSDHLQAALVAIIESPELALPAGNSVSRSDASSSVQLPILADGIEPLARALAYRCRSIVQSCLREEEWTDADQEFFIAILDGIRSWETSIPS